MSGALTTIAATAQAARTITNTAADLFGAVSQTVGLARTIDNSGNSWTGGDWWQQLQPGSWRGVGFVMDSAETHAGRRVAIHEYPYRDDVWPEDLGKLPRRFSIQCYQTGDDVYQQRDALLAACEQPGPGTLVHPTLGSVQCVLLDFAVADRREKGRYVEAILTFILAGAAQYPTVAIASGQAVTSAAAALNVASQGDLGSALAQLPQVARSAVASVNTYTGMALTAVNDASRMLGAVRGLQGYFGRYAVGSRQTMQPAVQTVQTALAAATTARTAVYAAADTVNLMGKLL
jgi:prophage DNA circulation protein